MAHNSIKLIADGSTGSANISAALESVVLLTVGNVVEDLDGDGIEDLFDEDDDGDGFSDVVEMEMLMRLDFLISFRPVS